MACSATVTRIGRRGSIVWVEWSDGTGNEWASAEDFASCVRGMANDPEFAKQLFLAYYLARDPGMVSPSAVVGRTLTVDLTVTPPVRVT